VAKLLLEKGADVRRHGEWSDMEQVAADTGTGEDFGPPLHIASLMGRINIISWLLEHWDVSSVNSQCGWKGIVGKWSR
jgi:ankyrin repeat protein